MLRDKIIGKNEEIDFVVDVGHIKSQCALPWQANALSLLKDA